MSQHIVLGISGSIAAYKCPEVIRMFMDKDCEIIVAASEHALNFVAKSTLEVLSKKPVLDKLFSQQQLADTYHIDIADWADLVIIAPATANMLGKMAHGIADDVLSTIMISVDCSVLVAPAMNDRMWNHAAVQENVKILKQRGIHFVNPEIGYLACDRIGEGRLASLETIVINAIKLL